MVNQKNNFGESTVSYGRPKGDNHDCLFQINLIDIGERAGSGIPNIFRVWREQGWEEPVIAESAEPDRTVLSLSLEKAQNGDKKAAINDGDKIKNVKTASQKAAILEYLTDHAFAKCADISAIS